MFSIFCSARETARVSTLASATIPVTSMPREEATLSPSSRYSATLARDSTRVWAAFSSFVALSPLLIKISKILIRHSPTASTNAPVTILFAAPKPVSFIQSKNASTIPSYLLNILEKHIILVP